MDTQTAGTTFHSRRAGEPGSHAMDDAWTVDDMVQAIRAVDTRRHPARRAALAGGVIAVALAAVAVLGSADRNAVTTTAARVAVPARIAATSPLDASAAPALVPATALRPVASRGRSVVIVMPADHDFILTSSIPVAGLAYSRPHGPRVRSVHVEVRVGGRLVSSADLPVYGGRFAGVLALDAPIDQAVAELRVSDPVNPSTPAGIRLLTIQAPAITTAP